MVDRPPCPVRSESVRAARANNMRRAFVVAFPPLPEGAVPVEIQVEFEDFTTHQPSGYVLRYEVPDPEGDLTCGDTECPNCGGGA